MAISGQCFNGIIGKNVGLSAMLRRTCSSQNVVCFNMETLLSTIRHLRRPTPVVWPGINHKHATVVSTEGQRGG